jgi:hypothetical protein
VTLARQSLLLVLLFTVLLILLLLLLKSRQSLTLNSILNKGFLTNTKLS